VSHLEYAAQVREISADFSVAAQETVALLGPNGAGKSTILNVIAGLIRPDSGAVTLAGQDLGRFTPHDRGIALLAQDPLLFPHLSALDNVAFGLRARRVHRQAALDTAHEWLQQVGADRLADRRPDALSGGQAQRVAIARALATTPKIMLLDEPMAALDVNARPEIRQLLGRILKERTAIIVTHDALDALLLADRVIVLEDGQVVEQGPTSEVLTHPRSQFAAQIAGLNLISGVWRDGDLTHGHLNIHGLTPEGAPATGAQTIAVFAPSAVAVYAEPPHGSPRNVLPATVTELEPRGQRVLARTMLDTGAVGVVGVAAEITPAAAIDLGLTAGTRVYLSVKATEVRIYPTG
jgi:ABC-type sulfate/molybdate transport systems ATPase subunit